MISKRYWPDLCLLRICTSSGHKVVQTDLYRCLHVFYIAAETPNLDVGTNAALVSRGAGTLTCHPLPLSPEPSAAFPDTPPFGCSWCVDAFLDFIPALSLLTVNRPDASSPNKQLQVRRQRFPCSLPAAGPHRSPSVPACTPPAPTKPQRAVPSQDRRE
jgi:hypothetical protein